MPVGTIADCEARVRVATSRLTPEQVQSVAMHHYTTGDSVWHSVHVVLNTPRCNCFKCRPATA